MENQWCKYHKTSINPFRGKQKITITVLQETKLPNQSDFIDDINGYNYIRLDGTIQTRRGLAFLIKNNLRFC